MVQKYEPNIGARYLGALSTLLKPECFTGAGDWYDKFEAWDSLMQRYEEESDETVSDNIKKALILEHAFSKLKEHLQNNKTVYSTYALMRQGIRAFRLQNKKWNPDEFLVQAGLKTKKTADPNAMQVDGITPVKKFEGNCSGCGKPGHKQSDCRTTGTNAAANMAKFKAQGNGKGASNAGTTTAGKGAGKAGKASGKGATTTAKFDGECTGCGKWGHKKADCWYKDSVPAGKGKGKKGGKVASIVTDALKSFSEQLAALPSSAASMAGTPSVAGSTTSTTADKKGVRAIFDGSYDFGGQSSSSNAQFVMGILPDEGGNDNEAMTVGAISRGLKSALVDSGACLSVCPKDFAPEYMTHSCAEKNLFSVQGAKIAHYGMKTVDVAMTDGATGSIAFDVTNVTKPVIAVAALNDKGHAVVFDGENSYILNKSANKKTKIVRRGNGFFLDFSVKGPGDDDPVLASVETPAQPELESEDWWSDDYYYDYDHVAVQGIYEQLGEIQARISALTVAPILGDEEEREAQYERMMEPFDADAAAAEEAEEYDDDQMLQDLADGPPVAQAVEMPMPIKPSDPALVAEHELTHMPFAAWCVHCAASRSVDDKHLTAMRAERKIPLLQLDYGFYGDRGELTTDNDPAEKVMALIGKEMLSGYPFAAVGLRKGRDEYLVSCVLNWIKIIGSEEIELQCDGESPIKALLEEVKRRRNDGVTHIKPWLRTSPDYSHQSNGGAEREVRTIGELTRTLLSSVRARFGCEMRASSRLVPWAIRHAAFLQARFHVMANRGKDTAYYIVTGKTFNEPIVQFAEIVHYRLLTGGNNAKLVPRFEKGVWIGREEQGLNHLLLTTEGVKTARCIRRLASDGQNDINELERACGLPWAIKDGVGEGLHRRRVTPARAVTFEMPAAPHISDAGEEEGEQTQPAEAEEADGEAEDEQSTAPNGQNNESDSDMGDDTQVPNSASASSTPLVSVPTPRVVDPVTGFQGVPPPPAAAVHRNSGELAAPGSPRGPSSKRESDGPGSPDKKAHITLIYCDDGEVVEEADDNTINGYAEHLASKEYDPDEMKAAIERELTKLEEFKVFTWVPNSEVGRNAKVFRHVWVKSVKDTGEVKARLACCDYNTGSEQEGSFCPTPSSTAVRVMECVALLRGYSEIHSDIVSAFIHAEEPDLVFMMPPKEWCILRGKTPGAGLWRLEKALYGRRTAGGNFRDHFESIVTAIGDYQRCPQEPTLFFSKTTRVALLHHVDDIKSHGPPAAHEQMLNQCDEHLLTKRGKPTQAGGPDDVYLGRSKMRQHDSITTKPHSKHIDKILSLLELEGAKPSNVPGNKEDGQVENGEELVDEAKAKIYRSCVGSAIFLSDDRFDIKYAVKELAKSMKQPTVASFARLKQLGRYLSGTKEYGHRLLMLNNKPTHIDIFVDADWGGTAGDRRSTEGGIVTVGGMVLTGWSSTQGGLPALSSAESELRGINRGCKEGIYVQNLLKFLDIDLPLRVWTDSSAARQAAIKLGVQKMRHLETQELFVQQLVKEKRVTVVKIVGTENPADIMTKYVKPPVLKKHISAVGLVDCSGQVSETASTVNAIVARTVEIWPKTLDSDGGVLIETQPTKKTSYGSQQWWKPTLVRGGVLFSVAGSVAGKAEETCQALTVRYENTMSANVAARAFAIFPEELHLLVLAIVLMLAVIGAITVASGLIRTAWSWLSPKSKNISVGTDIHGSSLREVHFAEFGEVFHAKAECHYLNRNRTRPAKSRRGCSYCVGELKVTSLH